LEFLTNTNVDFIGKRKMGFIISGAVIIIGLISLTLHRGPNFGIDFRGGAKIQAKFNRAVTEAELKAKLTALGYDRATIQIDAARKEATISLGYRPEFETQRAVLPLAADPGDAGATSLQVSSTAQAIHIFQLGDIVQLVDGDNRIRAEIRDIAPEGEATTFHLTESVGADLTQSASIQMQASVGRILSDALIEGEAGWHALPGGVNVSEVGPSVGKDLKWAALWSVLVSIAILLAYITWRFEFRFSMGAIAALVHDVLITLGIFSLLVKEINLPTVAAFLTIIGYSLNDTIVVFDRIRENAKFLRGVDQLDILNRSINQSLSRTVITSVTTLFVVLVIFFLSSAGEEINTFAFALIVGVIVGTYSSIFIASPIVYIWHLRDQQRKQAA
jgi:preprotein translocase subunit SecF